MPRYTIITPTLCRPSLLETAKSILSQTEQDWEWLIAVDVPLVLNKAAREVIAQLPHDPRIKIHRCGKSHKNFGNTCRNKISDKATGDYILYIDDDDKYADDKVLETLNQVTAPWAIFPCLRVGVYWLVEPPGCNNTGSAMFMHRRGLVKYHDPDDPGYKAYLKSIGNGEFWERLRRDYPQAEDDRWGWLRYAADGFTVEELKAKHPYEVVRGRPLTIYECANKGK